MSITCGKCGIEFSMPETRRIELLQSGDTFYCPNGHPRVYRPSEIEKLTKEIEELKKNLVEATSRVSSLRTTLENERARYRCPFDDCRHWVSRRHFLRMHIEKHHDVKSRKRLPANAGPSQ